MTTLNIKLSDDLKARIEAKAAQHGFDRIEAYVQSLLEEDASELVEDEELEQILLKRLANPDAIELTAALIDQFNKDVEKRRGAGRTAK